MINLPGWIWIGRILIAVLVIEGLLIAVALLGNGRE